MDDIIQIDDEVFKRTLTFAENEMAVGVFGVFDHISDYSLYPLEDFDRNVITNELGISIKDNEIVFVADTERSRLFNIQFYVKFDLDKSRAYFMDEDGEKFKRKSTKVRYAKILTTYASA